jgi:hypothetical protein
MRKYQFVKQAVELSAAGYILVPVPVYPEGEIHTINISKESGSASGLNFYLFNSFLPFSSIPQNILQSGSFSLDHTNHPFLIFDDTVASLPYTRRGTFPLHYKTVSNLKNMDHNLDYKLALIISAPGSLKAHFGFTVSFISR